MKAEMSRKQNGAAGLCAGYFVARRSKPHFGDSSSSRRVASPNLWPRHLLLFMRWLPAVTLRGLERGKSASFAYLPVAKLRVSYSGCRLLPPFAAFCRLLRWGEEAGLWD